MANSKKMKMNFKNTPLYTAEKQTIFLRVGLFTAEGEENQIKQMFKFNRYYPSQDRGFIESPSQT